MSRSRQARVTAVGCPRATSAAKVGPDRMAAGLTGSASPTTSLIVFAVSRSIPLAQTATGAEGARCGARSAQVSRTACAGTASRTASTAAASAASAVATISAVERDALQVPVVAAGLRDGAREAFAPRPQHDLAPRRAGDDGERRPPGAGAHDADPPHGKPSFRLRGRGASSGIRAPAGCSPPAAPWARNARRAPAPPFPRAECRPRARRSCGSASPCRRGRR